MSRFTPSGNPDVLVHRSGSGHGFVLRYGWTDGWTEIHGDFIAIRGEMNEVTAVCCCSGQGGDALIERLTATPAMHADRVLAPLTRRSP